MIQKDEDLKSIHRVVLCDTCGKGLKIDSDIPLNRVVAILKCLGYNVDGNTESGFTVKCIPCQRKDWLNEAKKEG